MSRRTRCVSGEVGPFVGTIQKNKKNHITNTSDIVTLAGFFFIIFCFNFFLPFFLRSGRPCQSAYYSRVWIRDQCKRLEPECACYVEIGYRSTPKSILETIEQKTEHNQSQVSEFRSRAWRKESQEAQPSRSEAVQLNV